MSFNERVYLMKRLAVLLVVLGLSGLFVGCQKKEAAPQPTEKPAATSTEQTGSGEQSSTEQQAPAGEQAQGSGESSSQGSDAQQ
ncbi:MAG: hypothetical protein H5U08_02140 [Thermogutta sp.]|uniref:hypothetical protein n=1 Tax=Thermogutta sp. TaxID=1962930 RepID=UPI0019A2E04F|nr:hypothetical protein [Thermogutta sp.]MBC7351132.1 hypothetical protein [Thermogutta sp.]